jgi:hypothetical protein
MEVGNTLAYYDMGAITTIKSFKVQAPHICFKKITGLVTVFIDVLETIKIGLYYKTFYNHNCCRAVISWSVCHCHSLTR